MKHVVSDRMFLSFVIEYIATYDVCVITLQQTSIYTYSVDENGYDLIFNVYVLKEMCKP